MAGHIVGLVSDLFFTSKISATASLCGIQVSFSSHREDIILKAREEKPSMILVDLNGETFDPVEAIIAIKADPILQIIPIVAFYSHVHTELKEKALQAGCDTVLTRSVFAKNLAEILSTRAH